MDALSRRRMFARAGICDPIPDLLQRRKWEWIDDRKIPEGEADGEFSSFTQWVNKASSWIGYTGAKCYDAHNRPCRNGGDMQRARDENAFPVRWYLPYRYHDPIIPSKRQMEALKFLAKNPECDLNEVREAIKGPRFKWENISILVGDDNISIDPVTNKATISPAGIFEINRFISCEQRASYVRK